MNARLLILGILPTFCLCQFILFGDRCNCARKLLNAFDAVATEA